jgi:uncharacterized protein
MESFLEETADGVILQLQVIPRSSKNQIVGPHDDALKLKLTSPPVDGAANKCCRDYLAKLFGVAKSNVIIISGETSRKKRVLLRGVEIKDVYPVINQ